MGFEALTAVKISIVVTWVVMSCNLVSGHQRFELTYRPGNTNFICLWFDDVVEIK